MPNLTEHHQLTSRLKREDAEVILKLIDLKTESDMDKVLNAINQLNNRIDNLEKSVDSRFSTLYWVLGFGMALLSTTIALSKLL